MTDTEAVPSSPNAAISSAISRIYLEWIGRGPTRVRTTIQGELVACVLKDTFTKAERSLVDAGEGDVVKAMRLRFQQAMSSDLNAAVSRVTGRRIEAFLSDHNIEPDIAIEAFVLAPELPEQSTAALR